MARQPSSRPGQQDLRTEILDAARSIIAERGMAGLTMRAIAQRIGYTATTLYLYFAGKDAIFQALRDAAWKELLAATTSGQPHPHGRLETLRRQMRQYIDFGLREPDTYRLALLMADAADVPGQGGQAEFQEIRTGWLESLLRAAIGAGEIPPRDARLAAQNGWCMLHGLVALLITNPRFPWLDTSRLINAHIQHIVDGLLQEA
jgi:AcrR family transcriptional regulator